MRKDFDFLTMTIEELNEVECKHGIARDGRAMGSNEKKI